MERDETYAERMDHMERDETYAERMNHMERAEPCGGMNPVETGAFARPAAEQSKQPSA
jgi:hypothetical protein